MTAEIIVLAEVRERRRRVLRLRAMYAIEFDPMQVWLAAVLAWVGFWMGVR